MSTDQDDELRFVHDYADLAGRRVLEIGVGEGRLTWGYAPAVKHVVGIDPDSARIKDALHDRPPVLPVDLLIARAEALPFRREMFDRALLAWSF